jgi:hypothetical protein
MKALSILLFLLSLAIPISAAEPARELDPKVAVTLIASISEISEKSIAIASIVAGSKKEDGFEAGQVRRVTSIHPVAEGGSRVRRVRCHDFYWNETYGWFIWEKREARGGDEVWIWSETEGDLVIK